MEKLNAICFSMTKRETKKLAGKKTAASICIND